MRCAIVPLRGGNTGSLMASLKRLGHHVSVWEKHPDISYADWIIFPGVGAMNTIQEDLQQRGLLHPLWDRWQDGQPFLGICLGLQLLFQDSDEGGRGLGWIEGPVSSLPNLVLPHIGWNDIAVSAHAPQWLKAYHQQCFYFVHSYYVSPDDANLTVSLTTYGQPFPSVVMSGSLIGMQFHPELSGAVGEALLNDTLR